MLFLQADRAFLHLLPQPALPEVSRKSVEQMDLTHSTCRELKCSRLKSCHCCSASRTACLAFSTLTLSNSAQMPSTTDRPGTRDGKKDEPSEGTMSTRCACFATCEMAASDSKQTVAPLPRA